MNPKNDHVYRERAVLFEETGDYNQAIQDYTRAAELNPSSGETFNSRGVIYQRLGLYGLAMEDFKRFLDLEPWNPRAYNSIAWLLATSEDADFRDGKRAVAYGEQAVRLGQDSRGNQRAAFYDTLAAAYAEFGDFESAVRAQAIAYALFKPLREDDQVTRRLKESITDL